MEVGHANRITTTHICGVGTNEILPDGTHVGVNADVTYVTGGSEVGQGQRQFVLNYRADPNQDRNVSILKDVGGKKRKAGKL